MYTDETYTQEVTVPASQGYVGPLLHGEVGEVIRVYFRNDVTVPVSLHPHGVYYSKGNEGKGSLNVFEFYYTMKAR